MTKLKTHYYILIFLYQLIFPPFFLLKALKYFNNQIFRKKTLKNKTMTLLTVNVNYQIALKITKKIFVLRLVAEIMRKIITMIKKKSCIFMLIMNSHVNI
ncbi:hypothetical protein PNEG_04319 [Pneumocystis murina B123]|uniref:Uncharacterized protein n=1 Tax=Pneumocystis murina (strain B123) TaxID=1069680 RepID=A0A0W4ZWY7_PNEMU|nr:hypothetical protein PNEG_04319 [Pneumocystis murina B123]KTW32876.1 hypothetical protein PNEG_04319 [Pneumocystis murina B123]